MGSLGSCLLTYVPARPAEEEPVANVAPLNREDLPEFERLFQAVERALGFVPNSYYTMGHRPEILATFSKLAATVLSPEGSVPAELKQLVAMVSSVSSGCRY